MTKKQKIKQDYDKTAKHYNKRYTEAQFLKYSVLDSLNIEELVLDLGCGTGLLATHLKRSVVGIDLSFEMCKLVKQEKVVCGDIDFLPFKDKTFSSVLSFTVLQNLPKIDLTIREIKRVAKSNSLLVLTILKKAFDDKLANKLSKNFDIQEYFSVDEDVGFVAKS